MGHNKMRPIVVTFTDTTDPVYVPVSRECTNYTISGETTGTDIVVDFTLENIVRSAASSYDTTSEDLQATPASADWESLTSTLATTGPATGDQPLGYALRLTMTGTGTSTVRIMQSD